MTGRQHLRWAWCIPSLIALAGCGGGTTSSPVPPPPPVLGSFTLQLSTASIAVIAGGQTRLTVTVQSKNGFSGNVTLSVVGLPSNATASFAQNPLSAGSTSDLVIQAAAGPAQTATLTIKGSSGSLSDSEPLMLAVVAQPTGTAPRSTYISVDGSLNDVIYDSVHKLVFAANPDLNQLEVFSASTKQRITSLPIPEAFSLDLSPDSTRLWVGTRTEFFYAVDTDSLEIMQRLTPPQTGPVPLTTVRAIVATANGSLFLRVGQLNVTTEGLLQYVPSTGQFIDRLQDAGGVPNRFYRSGDGSKVLFGTFGRVVLYDSATDSFLKNDTIQGSPLAAIRPDGAQIAMRIGADIVFLNAQLQEIGRSSSASAVAGTPIYSRDGRFVYFPSDISIIRTSPVFTALDAQTFAITGQIPDLFLTDDAPPNCTVTDVCDSVPGGTTIRAADETGLLIGPSPRGLSFVDASNPRSLPSTGIGFQINFPYSAHPSQGSLTGGTAVGLNGLFTSDTSIAFGQKLSAVTAVNPNDIQVVTPSSTVPGPVNISASSPSGWTALAPLAFSYGPQVQYLVPQGDRIAGGSTITILGYGFSADASQISVTIGGHRASVVSSSLLGQGLHVPLYVMQLVAPPGSPGPADLSITTPDGNTTLSGAFRYWQNVQDIPIAGTFSQILLDSKRNNLYLLNPSAQRIEVFSLTSMALSTPFTTGASPSIMTLLPDGSRLAVANSADSTISFIDPDDPAHPKTVNVPLPNNPSGYLPTQIAAASNAKLFINYTSRQNTGGAVQVLDLNNLSLAPSIAPCLSCLLKSSADGSKVYFAAVGDSGGAIAVYSAADDSFSSTRQLQDFIAEIDVGGDANRWLADFRILDGANFFESELFIPDLVAFASSPGVFGRRLHATGGLLYVPLVDGLQIYDVPHSHLLRAYGGLRLSTAARNTIAIDDSGQTLYLLSPTGIEIAQLDSVPLSIGHVSPATGPASGGTALTIRGSGFNHSTQVKVGATSVPVQFVDSNTLTVVTPPLPAKPVRFSVVNSTGEKFDLDAAFIPM